MVESAHHKRRDACMKNLPIIKILSFISLTAVASTAFADYNEAMESYEVGDYATAFSGLLTAAQENDTRAQAQLGRMYDEGLGTERDAIRAHMWLTVAYLRGERDLREPLAEMRERLSDGQVARAERLAIEWVEGGISDMHEFWNRD